MTRPDLDFWRIMNALTLIKAKYPDLRTGQILVNAAGIKDIFFLADATLADSLEAFLYGDAEQMDK